MAEEEENREKGFSGIEPMQSTSPRGSRYNWWGDEPINIDEALLDFEEYGFFSPPLSSILRTNQNLLPQTPQSSLPSNPPILTPKLPPRLKNNTNLPPHIPTNRRRRRGPGTSPSIKRPRLRLGRVPPAQQPRSLQLRHHLEKDRSILPKPECQRDWIRLCGGVDILR